jgi:hypothetical protein
MLKIPAKQVSHIFPDNVTYFLNAVSVVLQCGMHQIEAVNGIQQIVVGTITNLRMYSYTTDPFVWNF